MFRPSDFASNRWTLNFYVPFVSDHFPQFSISKYVGHRLSNWRGFHFLFMLYQRVIENTYTAFFLTRCPLCGIWLYVIIKYAWHYPEKNSDAMENLRLMLHMSYSTISRNCYSFRCPCFTSLKCCQILALVRSLFIPQNPFVITQAILLLNTVIPWSSSSTFNYAFQHEIYLISEMVESNKWSTQ